MSTVVQIRFSDIQYETLVNKANEARLSPGLWIKELALEAFGKVKRPLPPPKKLMTLQRWGQAVLEWWEDQSMPISIDLASAALLAAGLEVPSLETEEENV